MSKIYEALRRAEQERDRAALKSPVSNPRVAAESNSTATARAAAANALLDNPDQPNPYILPEPRRGRLPILLGPGASTETTNGNGNGNGNGKSATNGSSGHHKAATKVAPAQPAKTPAPAPADSGVHAKITDEIGRHVRATTDSGRHVAAVTPDGQPAGYIPVTTQIEDTFVVPFDLTQVATRVWNPSIHQLPALLERGAAVEQFRSLRSRMHEFRDLNNLKSILVSSGLPQEGKSFVAANLAVSFARHKASRVLLIDGDMRRPSLHRMLGTPAGAGLTEYLSGRATLVEVCQRGRFEDAEAVLPHGLASLTFISGGDDGEKAADLSGNLRFDKLIATVSPFFDWIVVDTSPVNLVADGVNLARACDGVLLIARGGRTRFETAQRALNELKASKILGFVLNAVENPPSAGGYYGYDGYNSYDSYDRPQA